MNFEIGPLIIMAIMALNSPSNISFTSLFPGSVSVIRPVREKSIFPPAAPNTILFGATSSFFLSTISGIPFKANKNLSSPKTSNLLMFSGISFSKFLISDKKLKTSSGDLSTCTVGDSKFMCFVLNRINYRSIRLDWHSNPLVFLIPFVKYNWFLGLLPASFGNCLKSQQKCFLLQSFYGQHQNHKKK